MDILGIIIFLIIVLIGSYFIVEAYQKIENERTKRIINIIFGAILVLSIILIIILFIYFFKLISTLGPI